MFPYLFKFSNKNNDNNNDFKSFCVDVKDERNLILPTESKTVDTRQPRGFRTFTKFEMYKHNVKFHGCGVLVGNRWLSRKNK